MNNVLVKALRQVALEEQPMEICERKGLGHPDSICDAIMNQFSIELSKEYLRRFDAILHHNLDKGLIAAGSSKVKFGGGEILKPMLIVYGDRATFEIENEVVPVDEIAINSTNNWLKKNLRFVDPDKHVRHQIEIKPGAASLQDIFKRKGTYLGANDTSAAVGYAPLSKTERLILDLESHLNSPGFKKQFPESGEDIKIMGFRNGRKLNLTVAMAFVDRFISSEADYFKKKSEIQDAIDKFIASNSDFEDVKVGLNALDVKGRGIDGLYLTVLGTSADTGDSGQVGRGNNVIGVIPLMRPMSSEAAAGKNSISHVGKIYNLLSFKIADRICRGVSGVDEVYVWLLSKIGMPIDQPAIASAQLVLSKATRIEEVSAQVRDIIDNELSKLDSFCKDLVEGKIPVC